MQFSNQYFSEAEFQDIQGLVRFGHGHLSAKHMLRNSMRPFGSVKRSNRWAQRRSKSGISLIESGI